jgi:CRP-like cAMP-binding protein
MITLLADISRLSAIQDILLLSQKGEILFGRKNTDPARVEKQLLFRQNPVSFLGKLRSARFVYDNGLCYIFQTDIGSIIVGLRDDTTLDAVESLCAAIAEKVTDLPGRKKALLQILSETNEVYMPQIIHELSFMVDEEVALGLIPLLEEYAGSATEVTDRLLLAVCQVLGDCSSRRAVAPLQRFLRQYTAKPETVNRDVERAARVSLRQLEFLGSEGSLDRLFKEPAGDRLGVQSGSPAEQCGAPKVSHKKIAKADNASDASKHEKAVTPRQGAEEEQRIGQLIKEGRKQEAAAIIMKFIEAAARQKKFDKAEKLRDKLIEIDSMLLTEIIRAAEIIEEQKAAAIQPEHLMIWRTLNEMLSPEEFAALYHSLTPKKYSNREVVVRRGTFLPQLILVNSGQIEVYAEAAGRNIFLKTVGPGEMMGCGTFFEASVWTVNGKSLGVELFVLTRGKMEQLAENHPALESKLIDFCALFISPNDLLRRSRKNRRKVERTSVAGRAVIQLLNRNGGDSGVRFKGEMFNISYGGLSFCARVSRKKNANMLFGGKIRIGIPVATGAQASQCTRTGVIVAVRGLHLVSNEYSVHVQFDSHLSFQEMQQVTENGSISAERRTIRGISQR